MNEDDKKKADQTRVTIMEFDPLPDDLREGIKFYATTLQSLCDALLQRRPEDMLEHARAVMSSALAYNCATKYTRLSETRDFIVDELTKVASEAEIRMTRPEDEEDICNCPICVQRRGEKYVAPETKPDRAKEMVSPDQLLRMPVKGRC